MRPGVLERRIYVVHLRRFGLTFREIGLRLGVSASRAHTIYRAGARYVFLTETKHATQHNPTERS
jgi:hypothetical protein